MEVCIFIKNQFQSLGQRDAPCEEKNQSQTKNKSKVSQVREMHIEDGAGGGGGGSYVFLVR